MTIEQIIAGMKHVIYRLAKEKDMFISNPVEKKLEIPEITASSDTGWIKIRSFWGNPELDIYEGGKLGVVNYCIRDGKWKVGEVRACGDNYEETMAMLYEVIKEIEKGGGNEL